MSRGRGGFFAAGLVFLLGMAAGAAFGPIGLGRGKNPAFETWGAAEIAPGQHPVDVLYVIDGDTFEGRVHVWPAMT